MSDKFLELFTAEVDIATDDTDTTFIVELDIKKVIAEVNLPNDMVAASMGKELGELIIERVVLDLTEGVTEALNKTNPEVFPSFIEYIQSQSN